MLKTILELFVLYIIYKLVFGFIIPIYQTTKHLSKKMSDMQQQMKAENDAAIKNQNQANKAGTTSSSSSDYIDYEEVK
jgi:hypothetical protein